MLNYANWGLILTDYLYKPVEVAIVGPDFKYLLKSMASEYLPEALFMGGANEQGQEWLKDRYQRGKTAIYLCRGKTCLFPVYKAQDALEILSRWH